MSDPSTPGQVRQLILYNGNTIYQENTNGKWYQYTRPLFSHKEQKEFKNLIMPWLTKTYGKKQAKVKFERITNGNRAEWQPAKGDPRV